MEINKKIQDKFKDVKPTKEVKEEIKKVKVEKKRVTVDDAIRLIVDSKDVHTFRQGRMNMVIGSDCPRDGLIETIRKFEGTLVLSGKVARGLGHGLALFDDIGALFIKTHPDAMEEYDPE